MTAEQVVTSHGAGTCGWRGQVLGAGSDQANWHNQRKNRKGAFWEDHYPATAVETGSHVVQCIDNLA